MSSSTLSRNLLIAGLISLAGCDAPPSPSPSTEDTSMQDRRPAQPANGSELRQRQMAFLNRVRQADPSATTIDRALLNEQNELGLVLDRRVQLDKIPALMRSMMAQMAHEFPGQDLTVIAYAPSSPPRKIGTAHLNSQTRDMTYTPEK